MSNYTFTTNTPFVNVSVGPRTDVAQYIFHLANGDSISVLPAYDPADFESAYIPAGDTSGRWDVRRWDGTDASPESVALAHLAALTA